MVDAKQMQDGGVQVSYVHGVGRDVVAELVGGSVGMSCLHAAARHPHGEAAGMVVAPGLGAVPLALSGHATSELPAPDDEGVVEESAALEVGDERGAGLVGVAAARGAPGGEAAVVVPVGMEELHEAHAALDETSREDAVGGVAAWASGIGTVELEDLVGLVGEVGELGHAGLHAEGHLILADAGRDLGVAGAFESASVQFGESVEHLAAESAGKALGVAQVEHGILGAAELHALVTRGQEAAAPVVVVQGLVARALHAREEHEVVGEVLVVAAKAVARPCADAGASGNLVAGQELRHGRRMVDLVGVHRLDEAQVVRDLPKVRQPFADGRAGLAAALEAGRAGLDQLALVRGHGGQALSAADGLGEFGAGQVGQAGLVVEELDLRGAAGLRQEDDALCLGGMMGQGREAWFLRLGGGARREGAEGHGPEGQAGLLDEGAAMEAEGVHGQESLQRRMG